MDSNGEEHVLKTVGNNSCDAKNPFVMSDVGLIIDKANLPVFSIRYGPLKHEFSKVNITLGQLTCVPSEGDPSQSLKEILTVLKVKSIQLRYQLGKMLIGVWSILC